MTVSRDRQKTVYIGSTWRDLKYTDSAGRKVVKCFRLVYEVIERNYEKNGQMSMFSNLEVNTFWTNVGWTDRDVIESYHDHGTSEQFHSEYKSDMKLEIFPSGKFATNSFIGQLGMFVYNIERVIGQISLECLQPKKRPVVRRRLSTIINHVINIEGKYVYHARRHIICVPNNDPWMKVFIVVAERFNEISRRAAA